MDTKSIAIFPLPSVLFPRMPMPIHIYEPRYRRMLEHCIREKAPLGVVTVAAGEARLPDVSGCVGTVARVSAVHRLAKGRLNILAIGSERFRVSECWRCEDDYLEAAVETYCDGPPDDEVVCALTTDARDAFGQYFKMLIERIDSKRTEGIVWPEYDLPDDPADLSFVIAAVLQLPLQVRLELLSMTDTALRLAREIELLHDGMEKIAAAPVTRVITATPFDVAEHKKSFSRN